MSGRLRRALAALALCALPWAAVPAQAAQTEDDGPERAVSSLWRAMSHGPGEAADADALRRLFHPQAVVFGSRERDGRPSLRRTEIGTFLPLFERVEAEGFHECEIARTVQVHDRFATVTSVVESRTDPAAPAADYTGVNSLQLYRDDDGWRILSLYYHLGGEAAPIAHDGVPGVCLP